jgi:hypothetical protein
MLVMKIRTDEFLHSKYHNKNYKRDPLNNSQLIQQRKYCGIYFKLFPGASTNLKKYHSCQYRN